MTKTVELTAEAIQVLEEQLSCDTETYSDVICTMFDFIEAQTAQFMKVKDELDRLKAGKSE